jgi:hypothetical protein
MVPARLIKRNVFTRAEESMKRSLALILMAVLALAGVASLVAAQAGAQTAAQDKPADMKKPILEIVGEYEFAAEGQTLIVQFIEMNGKLFGAPPGETPEEIQSVEGKPLCFDITTAEDGDYYLLQFVRNDKGVIDKCVMTVQGMVVDGMKIIK